MPYVGTGRAGLGGRHGQGDDEDALRGARPAGRRVARLRARATGSAIASAVLQQTRHARPAGVRQAGQPRIERRHLEGEDAATSSCRRSSSRSQFDRKVVVEAARAGRARDRVRRARQRRSATSVPGEIIPSREFYDYEAKYLDEGSKTVIPADLTPAQVAEVQRLAIEAFRAIDGAGLARVDFLLARDTGAIYLNEINTMPGFTTISMYSKMWEATGVDLRGARRSADPARARAARGEAAAEDQRAVSLRLLAPAVAGRRSCCLVAACRRRRRAPQTRHHRRAGDRARLRPDPRRRLRSAARRRCRRPARRRRRWPAWASRRSACGGRSSSISTTARSTRAFWPRPTPRSPRPSAGPAAEPERAEAWFYLGAAYGARGAVARATRRAARGRARRQAHQGSARAGARARSGDARCRVRHRHVSLLRRRRAGGLQVPAVPAAAAGRRSRRRPRADRTRQPRRAAGPRRSAVSRSTCSTSGTSTSRRTRWRSSAACRQRYPHNPLFRQIEAEILDVYFHDHAASLRGVRAAAGARAVTRGVPRRHRRSARAPQHRAQSIALQQRERAISELDALIARQPTRRRRARTRARAATHVVTRTTESSRDDADTS